MWSKSGCAVVCSIPEAGCNRGITPKSTHNAQTRLLFQNCQTSQINQLFIIHWNQECPSGAMWPNWRYALVCIIPEVECNRGIPPNQLNIPRHISFFRIVKPARKITFYYIHWSQECPSLVPCGPKVGGRYSAVFLRPSATTGSTPQALNLSRHISFFRIVKPARKIPFFIRWKQECPALVPCGQK